MCQVLVDSNSMIKYSPIIIPMCRLNETFKAALTLSNLNLPLSPHPLQAANCCRNSRLVVDEDDLKWVTNLRKLLCIVNQFHGHFHSKTPSCKKIKPVFKDVK